MNRQRVRLSRLDAMQGGIAFMTFRREWLAFAATLALLLAGFFSDSLLGGKVLSPADVLLVSASFRGGDVAYEPANRLLMDPVLQFQPWLEFSRRMIRQGRLPLWNDLAGCGAPHLANGQSAVFDPFHALAYAGTLPEAHGWMAAARLWVAGVGMFLLARSWGLGAWGRWFAGLAFSFCGFMVVWLLFPVTSVAVWMPWLFWASDRVLDHPGPRTVGGLALVSALVLLGGHVQTSAHVLIAAAAYAAWRVYRSGPSGETRQRLAAVTRRGWAAWSAGVLLGIAVASVEVIPLAGYLTRSPVWSDRARVRRAPWALERPRLLDAVCTALPYMFGSQRQGHPNLARALGVHNLNESAGGFAGLATLVWLAPLGCLAGRRQPRAAFLAGLGLFGAMGAFGIPPVANLLRAVPVLDVVDNRRLTLWVAFALVLLGGIGIEQLARARTAGDGARLGAPGWGQGPAGSLGLAAGLGLVVLAAGIGRVEPWLSARAKEHYIDAAARTPGADQGQYRARAERQVQLTLAFLPRYLFLAGAHVFGLVALAALWRRGRVGVGLLRPALLGLTLCDLLGFGLGLNPAIAASADRPEAPVIAYLRREVGGHGRILGLGEELSPNTLMRYGLSDIRNYDSIELGRSLDWFEPLYATDAVARTSRRTVTWDGVLRSRERLREAAVSAVVAATPPPRGAFARVDRVGPLWIARLDGRPLASAAAAGGSLEMFRDAGLIRIRVHCTADDRIVVRETLDPAWRAEVDGKAVQVAPYRGAFLAVPVAAGRHELVLRYAPPEVPLSMAISISALAAVVFALTGFRPFRSTRIIYVGLGRSQAVELESESRSSPDFQPANN
jgi:hypothetical protein